MRAWLALREAGVDFEEEVVDIRRPQRFANLAAIGRISPAAAVPVLIVDGRVIFDSLAIMEYANDVSGGALLPDGAVDRAVARSVLAWQHSGLSQIAGNVSFESAFYQNRRQLTDAEVAECRRLQTHLDALLAASSGPFLFGRVSLADLALVPTMIRLTRNGLDLTDWPRIAEWTKNLLQSPAVTEWMAEADDLPPVLID
jgi:glutathione S-transferase